MDIQLVFQFSVNEATDFDQLLSLENVFQITLGENHLVDGHDFGSGEMNIFVHTNDAESAFEICESCIPPTLKASLKSAYRLLSGDQYHWICPENSVGEFKVA